MKKLAQYFFLIAFLAFPLGIEAAGATPGAQDEMEKSFQVRPGGVLYFDADLAEVEIVTGDSETVHVESTRTFEVNSSEEANELRRKLTVEMTQSDNDVKVVVRLADDRNQTNRKVRLEFRITMPRKFNLDLRTAGSATVGDLEGAMKAATAGGSLKLGNVSGPVTAKSEGGSVTIGNVGGNLEARSYGGSAFIGRVNGRALTLAEGGSISIEEAAELTEATASGGSVKASISKPPRSDCKITANAGSIDLRLPASAAVSVDAACTAGGISTDFDVAGNNRAEGTRLKGAINGGGPALVLRATAGSIHLHK